MFHKCNLFFSSPIEYISADFHPKWLTVNTGTVHYEEDIMVWNAHGKAADIGIEAGPLLSEWPFTWLECVVKGGTPGWITNRNLFVKGGILTLMVMERDRGLVRPLYKTDPLKVRARAVTQSIWVAASGLVSLLPPPLTITNHWLLFCLGLSLSDWPHCPTKCPGC